MTHRPIAPIPINGFEPGGTPRALPIFEWVDPSTLLVDEGYQRDLSERSLKLIRKIVAGWDWAKFSAPIAVLTDAGLELIDGQCTSIAAATHPAIEQIPVMIVEVPERAERAAAFIGQNRDRVAVTAMQLHVAAVAAQAETALAIERVREAAGVKFLLATPKEPAVGDTMAVSAIGAMIGKRGEERATEVLKALVAGGCAPVAMVHIKAADILLHTEEYAELTVAKLPAVIRELGPKAEAEAKVFVAAHPSTSLSKALAIQWFKGRRVKAAAVVGIPTSKENTPAPKEINPAHGKRDCRAKLSGWIPGVFLLRCSGCDETYQGDKRSRSCADCAYGCREAKSA